MKKNILKTLITAIAFSGGAIAFAETGTNASVSAEAKVNIGTLKPLPIRPIIKDNLEARKEVRASTTSAIKAIRVETRGEIKEKMEERNSELKELRVKFASSTEARRDERKDERRENLRKIAEQRIRKMFERMQATIDRELSITAKIEARIVKFKTNGGNTEESEKYVAEAKVHFSDAQATLDSLKNSASTLATVIDSGENASTTNKDLGRVKNIVSEVEKHIRLGHQSLVKAVVSLKGLGERPKATTTTSTTITN